MLLKAYAVYYYISFGVPILSDQVFHFLENLSFHFAVEMVGLVCSTSTPLPVPLCSKSLFRVDLYNRKHKLTLLYGLLHSLNSK